MAHETLIHPSSLSLWNNLRNRKKFRSFIIWMGKKDITNFFLRPQPQHLVGINGTSFCGFPIIMKLMQRKILGLYIKLSLTWSEKFNEKSTVLKSGGKQMNISRKRGIYEIYRKTVVVQIFIHKLVT